MEKIFHMETSARLEELLKKLRAEHDAKEAEGGILVQYAVTEIAKLLAEEIDRLRIQLT